MKDPLAIFLATVISASFVPVADGATNGDFSLDGKADVLWLNDIRGQHDGSAAVWIMDGSVRVDALFVDSNLWAIVGVGDFDGDGEANDIVGKYHNGRLAVWFYDFDPGFGAVVRDGLPVKFEKVADLDWMIVSVNDFDRDGDADILWQHEDTGKLVLWHMDGTVRVALTHIERRIRPPRRVAGSGDFDGDGDPDLVVRDSIRGSVFVYSYEAGVLTPVGAISGTVKDRNWRIVAVGDFDGDGDADLFWRHPCDGNAVWIMQGLTRSVMRRTDPESRSYVNVVAPQ